jgi:tRNA 2-thiouridine synthesizing protein A
MSDNVLIDCIGEYCPVPVMKLAKVAESSPKGTLIEILSDDEGSKVDIPVWCRMKSQEFVGREDRARGWAFFVKVT